jgi:hypothetical protein
MGTQENFLNNGSAVMKFNHTLLCRKLIIYAKYPDKIFTFDHFMTKITVLGYTFCRLNPNCTRKTPLKWPNKSMDSYTEMGENTVAGVII